MLSYCFKCRRNTKSINPKVSKTTNLALVLSTCASNYFVNMCYMW